MKPSVRIRLRDLWQAHHIGWSVSYLLGAATLLSTVLLLAFSGWFISAAALAGGRVISGVHAEPQFIFEQSSQRFQQPTVKGRIPFLLE